MGSQGSKPEKAKLSNADTREEILTCLFSPTQFSMDRSNTWKSEAKTGSSPSGLVFEQSTNATFSVDLFFDTYYEDGEDAKSVQTEYVSKLEQLMLISEKQNDKTQTGRPPRVEFLWGPFRFVGVIKTLKKTFSMFKSDGTPVRATVGLTFEEFDPKGLPSLDSALTQTVRTIQNGDSLGSLAHKMYGDASEWRPIADANKLKDPRQLKAGQQLTIPSL
jgi:Contractile injection system tube protein/LysM domain